MYPSATAMQTGVETRSTTSPSQATCSSLQAVPSCGLHTANLLWHSHLAELTSLSEATKQALYVKHLLGQLKITEVIIQLHNNNQSALHLTTQLIHSFHARMKHYNIKLAHLRDTITQGHLVLHYCPTEIMPADILTKALPITCYKELKVLLGLVHMKNMKSFVENCEKSWTVPPTEVLAKVRAEVVVLQVVKTEDESVSLP
jgi:hypothetical protein